MYSQTNKLSLNLNLVGCTYTARYRSLKLFLHDLVKSLLLGNYICLLLHNLYWSIYVYIWYLFEIIKSVFFYFQFHVDTNCIKVLIYNNCLSLDIFLLNYDLHWSFGNWIHILLLMQSVPIIAQSYSFDVHPWRTILDKPFYDQFCQ